jgi:hypothetical protein
MTNKYCTTQKSQHLPESGSPDEPDVTSETAARLLRGMRTREAADRKRKEAEQALEAELVAPLVPGSKPHSLDSIAAQRPKITNPFHEAPAPKEQA